MGYFQDDKGNKSMIRLLAFMGFVLGGAIAVAGVTAMFIEIDGATTDMLIGGGLAGGGELFKILQKKQEA